MNRGTLPFFSNSRNSLQEHVDVVGVADPLALDLRRRRSRGTCGRPGPARGLPSSAAPSPVADALAVLAVAAVAAGRRGRTRPRCSPTAPSPGCPRRRRRRPRGASRSGPSRGRCSRCCRPSWTRGGRRPTTWPLQYRLSSSTNSSASLWWFGVTFSPNITSVGSPLPCFDVAEHLVVGAVLLDDVDDVLDRRRVADLGRDRRLASGAGRRSAACRSTGSCGRPGRCTPRAASRPAPARSTAPRRAWCRCTGTAGVAAASLGLAGLRRALAIAGSACVWFPLPTPTSRFLPSGVTATAVGYQPVGMKPLTWLAVGARDVDDGDAVVVGVGDVERLAVGRDGQGVGRAPLRRPREQGGEDRLGDDAALRVDHRDAVARGAGDEQPVVLRVQGDLVRVLADRDPGDDAEVVGIDGEHRRPAQSET